MSVAGLLLSPAPNAWPGGRGGGGVGQSSQLSGLTIAAERDGIAFHISPLSFKSTDFQAHEDFR